VNGTLYIGVTGNLKTRIWEHRHKSYMGFTSKYNIYKLVYYEIFHNIDNAISREKQLKNWKRNWKIKLIQEFNFVWNDLWFGEVEYW
jgi:putative endonuclease